MKYYYYRSYLQFQKYSNSTLFLLTITLPTIFAGEPNAIEYGGILESTKLNEPITLHFPILLPILIIELGPM